MKILLVAPAWVGDMVMADCLVQLLARRDGTDIEVLAPPATAALGERMAGVSAVHRLELGHGELGLGPCVGESRYGVLNDRRRLDAERYPLMIERFMALAGEPGAPLPEPYPVPALMVDADARAAALERLDLSTDGGVLALCPGAEYGPAKRWPAHHYAAVARHAAGRGRQVWLLGSPGERAVCEGIRRLVPAARNLAGETSLLEAVDLLSAADAVVCNDSGLMHVAGAVGTRVVAVFGSTSPGFTPPLGADARVAQLDLPCSPCFQRTCPLGHQRCLEELEPERVIAWL